MSRKTGTGRLNFSATIRNNTPRHTARAFTRWKMCFSLPPPRPISIPAPTCWAISVTGCAPATASDQPTCVFCDGWKSITLQAKRHPRKHRHKSSQTGWMMRLVCSLFFVGSTKNCLRCLSGTIRPRRGLTEGW